MNVGKEGWYNLTDEQKTKVLKQYIKDIKFDNIDYAKMRKRRKYVEEHLGKVSMLYSGLQNPCLVLSCPDENMTDIIYSLLFHNVEVENVYKGPVPIIGYFVDAIYNDPASLAGFDEDEKKIITRAVQILKNKGCYDSKRID